MLSGKWSSVLFIKFCTFLSQFSMSLFFCIGIKILTPFMLVFFMYFVYIIYSKKLDRFYIGYSEDPLQRVLQHNTGISTFTSKSCDWILVYTEEFPSRKLAYKREMEIKKKKSRKYLMWLINDYKRK